MCIRDSPLPPSPLPSFFACHFQSPLIPHSRPAYPISTHLWKHRNLISSGSRMQTSLSLLDNITHEYARHKRVCHTQDGPTALQTTQSTLTLWDLILLTVVSCFALLNNCRRLGPAVHTFLDEFEKDWHVNVTKCSSYFMLLRLRCYHTNSCHQMNT